MATFSNRHYGGVWTDPSLARWYTLVPVLVSRLELVHAGLTSELPLGAQRSSRTLQDLVWKFFFKKLKKGVALIIRFDKRET